MSSATRKKDDGFRASVSAKPEQIDRASAIEWGKANGVRTAPAETFQARLNSRRAELRLPRLLIEAKPRLKVVAERPKPAPAAVHLLATTEDQLLDLVAAHTGTITCLVSPQVAGWLLDLNTGNRPILKANLERFRAILQSSRWQNTGEPIIVSREGILNDGQHRLLAIKGTGIPAEIDVRFGVPRDAFHVTGFGKRRSTAQVLGIEGYSNATCQASIARLLRAYDAGQMGSVRQTAIEPDETLRIVEADDRIPQIAATIQRFPFQPCRCGGFGFPLVMAARKIPLERVLEFARLVSSGLAQDETSPTYRLHQKLAETRGRRERLAQVELAALTIKAWNAWVGGKAVGVLKLVDADRTSTGFPQLQWA